jgi:hypothetical protein
MARRAMQIREKRIMSRIFGVLAIAGLAAGIIFSITHYISPLPAFVLTALWVAVTVYYATAPTKPDETR